MEPPSGFVDNEIAVYNRLCHLLEGPIDDEIWMALTEHRHIEDAISYAEGHESWGVQRNPTEDLVVKYQAMLDFRTWTEGPQAINAPRAPARGIFSARADALHRILCWEAELSDEIVAFRKDYLNGGSFNSHADAVEWIESLGIPLTFIPGVRESPPQHEVLGLLREDPPELGVIEYRLPGGGIGSAVVGDSQELSALSNIAWELSAGLFWPLAAATSFVLTGSRPHPTPQFHYRILKGAFNPRLVRIVMEVDAHAGPAAVAEFYREARNEAIGEGTRTREMTPRNCELAVFAAATRDSGDSWNQVCEDWNEAYPFWGHTDPRKFKEGIRRAYKRVTGRTLDRQPAD